MVIICVGSVAVLAPVDGATPVGGEKRSLKLASRTSYAASASRGVGCRDDRGGEPVEEQILGRNRPERVSGRPCQRFYTSAAADLVPPTELAVAQTFFDDAQRSLVSALRLGLDVVVTRCSPDRLQSDRQAAADLVGWARRARAPGR